MWYIRVLTFYLVITLITIVMLPALFIMHLLSCPYKYKYYLAKIYSILFIKLAEIICGLQYEVKGLEQIPSKPAVFVANHQSFWENIFVQLVLPIHSWVIKRELLDIPLFGWGLGIMQPIAVDRRDLNSVSKIVKEGKNKLQDGLSVIIFPESTRVALFESKSFKPSAIKLAIEAKAPLVMIAHNAGMYWPKSFWIKQPGRITFEVLSVIYTDAIDDAEVRELTKEVEKTINHSKATLAKKVAMSTYSNALEQTKI